MSHRYILKMLQFHFPVPRTLGTLLHILQNLRAVLGTGVQVVELKFMPSTCLWELPSCGIISVAEGVCRAMRY